MSAGVHKRVKRVKRISVFSVFLMVLGAVSMGSVLTPAHAADELLQVVKLVDNATPEPGETFTYTIQMTCSEQDCLDAQLTDVLPAGLEGFGIDNATFTPNAATVPRSVTWTPGNTTTPPATVQPGTGFTVDFQQGTDDPVGTGLVAGQTFTVTLSLRVPDDYPPGSGPDIVNTARATATNSDPAQSSATVNIDSEIRIAVAVDKTWAPATQSFLPGAVSTIGLSARNTSNVPVDTITIQEPKAAPDGAAELDPSNPFTITDFTGFDDVSLPAGFTGVQVDAYVFSGSTWSWVAGDPIATPGALALPDGVTKAEVGGVRITCTGTIAPGATMSLDLGLEQRATDRDDDSDLSTAAHRVDNVATGSVDADGQDPATDDGAATHAIAPLIPSVDASKNITPARITAGQSSTATIAGTNGDDPVTRLHIADLDFFTEDIVFGGFTAPPTWPDAASTATIVYHHLDGSSETVDFDEGDLPADPSEPISGFEITWTGPIAPSESGGAAFRIDTTEDATGGAPELSLTNKVDADVTAANGLTDDATASDGLEITDPSVDVTLTKKVRPSSAVEPGETVISSLTTRATATGDGAVVEDIVIEDAWAEDCSGFWNAFDATAIAPTQVPAGAELTVEFQAPDGSWQQLAVYGPEPTATVFELAAIPAVAQGIRFRLHDADGFPADTTVTPNIVFAARADLRDPSCPDPQPDTPTTYVNAATADVAGTTAGGKNLTADDDDTDDATVTYPADGGDGPGPDVDVDKAWDRIAVSSQSGEQAGTTLTWDVTAGFGSVLISDAATDPATADVAGTVFDAFDLLRVGHADASDEPYSKGWYLKYDTVTKVELFRGGGWQEVAAPGGSWMRADRGFKGYSLTGPESAGTTGVRFTLTETAADTAARTAARQPGAAFDPFAPAPGSGVGSGSSPRSFDLGWQVRDKTRSDGGFVIEDRVFNSADEGVVTNTVAIEGTPIGGGTVDRETAADTIQILDPDPVVEVTKSVTPTANIHTPPTGTPAAEYPTATWTISGHNGSVARASYVRITDPATCTDTALGGCQSAGTPAGALANPFALARDYLTDAGAPNPFERFDVRGLAIAASIPGQVDLAATKVWLLRFEAGTYTHEETTAAAVNAMTPAQLATVVGFSVTFQDTDPATSGGTLTQDNDLTITVDSRLRATLRSSGAPQVLPAPSTHDVTNRAFAQSYDPVGNPGTVTGDVDDATTVLTGGIVNIAPTKSVSPATITEPKHDAGDDQVTVVLGANQGANPRSTLSPARVVIEDQADSPEFWNAFDFTGLGVISFPSGANRVQVDLYDGTTWHEGTAGSTAVLPGGVANADVQGIRFTFTRADGGLFSSAVPAQNWSASAAITVDLRSSYRDSGEQVDFPSTVRNTQTSQSFRPDGNDSDPVDATATVTLTPGTHELEVNKLTNDGNRLASVGDAVPFKLTLRNSGTGYVTLAELRDALPSQLTYTGDPAPTFTGSPQGTLGENVDVAASPDGSALTFAWPEGGRRMQPGETFTIHLSLVLQPGLGTGQTATNTITAQTEEPLTRCANTASGGSITTDWSTDPYTCGTSDFVGVVTGPNLYTVKGVRGSLPGAYQPGSPAAVCTQNLTATGGSYFRSPCVANSQLGGTDDWVLSTANAGTVNVDEMTIFDQLPVAGDRQIISGASRGSQYRPELVAGSLNVAAPAGTTVTTQVTTSADVCVGTWTNLTTQPVCEQQGESWTTADGSTDWSKVTGLRVHLDFTTTASGNLRPGQSADVTYSTTNEPRTDADPSGASTVVPAADQLAWNQFGVKFRYSGVGQFSKIAPSRVGVHLRFGSIKVVKEITGPAAQYAADEFRVEVACTVGDVALDLGSDAVVELNEGNDFEVRIDGIPLGVDGTECVVTEQGDVGEFGEASRTGSPATLLITQPTDPSRPIEGQAVPVAQVATITNDYRYTGLSVTKRVVTTATTPVLGPFTFTLSCTTATGIPVTFDDDGTTEIEFVLEAGQTYDAPANRIPVGAACELTETDTFFAGEIVVTGDDVADNGDGTATITPGIDPAEVVVANAYDAGTVTLEKVVDGDGAARYGTGVFGFVVTCDFHGRNAFDDEVALRAGQSRTLGPFPVGTVCTVAEPRTAGATTSVLDPADGVVTIAAPLPDEAVSQVKVTATNTFDLSSIDVRKVVRGDRSAEGAAGPFRVGLVCTWQVDGVTTPVTIPGGSERRLSRANGYRASYADLPAAARCRLTELTVLPRVSTEVTADVNGEVTTVDGRSVAIDLGKTDGPGQASVTVVNTFAGPSIHPPTDGGLPNTGAPFGRGLLPAGVLLLVAGLGAVLWSRRARA
ncbi:DUF5979 domain-containing protein [Nocardioides marmoriginsengisoli]|uniref:DUF5979 domain-containing protein n=1 Tax=Nocardioides marmoriginsengisoli TaxID=661483 RepID=UPI00161B6A01|nr:DUF5979 domain-containing protein [Nocardioides marmoriginsengisoli]